MLFAEPSGLACAQLHGTPAAACHASCRWCSGEPGEVMEGGDGGGADHIRSSLSVVLTAAAPVSHSAPRQWPQVDHGSIRFPRGLLAHGPFRGGATS